MTGLVGLWVGLGDGGIPSFGPVVSPGEPKVCKCRKKEDPKLATESRAGISKLAMPKSAGMGRGIPASQRSQRSRLNLMVGFVANKQGGCYIPFGFPGSPPA